MVQLFITPTNPSPVHSECHKWKRTENINPLNNELNLICHLLALLAHHIIHVSRIRVKVNFRSLRNIIHYMGSFIYEYTWTVCCQKIIIVLHGVRLSNCIKNFLYIIRLKGLQSTLESKEVLTISMIKTVPWEADDWYSVGQEMLPLMEAIMDLPG